MKHSWYIEGIGWIGVLCLLGAYGLVTLGIIDTGWIYQLLNIVGALGLGVIAIYTKNYQSLTVQIVWVLVGVHWMLNLL